MSAIPEKVQYACRAALEAGFTREEIKHYIREQWPEADRVVTYATLSVWKREIDQGKGREQ